MRHPRSPSVVSYVVRKACVSILTKVRATVKSRFMLTLIVLLLSRSGVRSQSPEMVGFQVERWFIESQIQHWSEQVRKNPKDFETMVAIGAGYGKLHRYDKAVEWFRKALVINPSYAEAYLGLAAAYGFQGHLDEKIAACKQAIRFKPEYADAYFTLGTAYGKKGQYKESVQALEKGVKLEPNSAEGHFSLGLAYVSLGDMTHALAEERILTRMDTNLAKQLKDIIDAPSP